MITFMGTWRPKRYTAVTRGKGKPSRSSKERWAGAGGTKRRKGRWSSRGLRRATQRRKAVTSHSPSASFRKVPVGNKRL